MAIIMSRLDPAKAALAAVKAQAEIAVVAGGFLRDLDTGREPRDLDIFTHGFRHEPAPDLYDFAADDTRAVMSYVASTYDDQTYGGMQRGLVEVYLANIDGCPWPVNIIDLAEPFTPGSLIADFDFTICQIAMDTEGTLTRTANYLDDKHQHIIRLVNPTNPTRDQHRLTKLVEKFPGWKVVLHG